MTTIVSVPERTSGFSIFFGNIGKAISGFVGRHKVLGTLALLLLLVGAVLFREEWQPYVVIVRRYFAPIAVSIGIVSFFFVISRSAHWWKRIASMLVAFLLVAGCVVAYEYVALWVRYNAIDTQAIDKLPETDHERIQPLASVHGLAQGVTGDSRQPAPPDFVWMRNKTTGKIEFQWTMGVEPKMALDKIFGTVDEVISVSGTDPSPQFTPASKNIVRFSVGEGLWLSSKANIAAVRAFSLAQFASYEPSGVRYIRDDAGEMVEVISLLRWRGIFFPYPEFGGVLIVRQEQKPTLESFLTRVLLGAGSWISPERIQEFSYLRGQNILPERVSRYTAESLRFMNGFLAPFPGWHQGDVRIPDSKESMNQQPYATFFKETNGMPGMLYHYFSLEPYLAGKHGLVASVLIPADGTHHVLVYHHEAKGESLMGVSMVPALVRDSKKSYTWGTMAPVEERPYVRYDKDGKRHLLWLTTVVTYKDAKKESFVTGSVPEVALVDAATQEVIWVDPRDQEGWAKLLH